jgi:hypothetical protein
MKGVQDNVNKINTNTTNSTPLTTRVVAPKLLNSMTTIVTPKAKPLTPLKKFVPSKNDFNDDRTGSMTGAPSPAERKKMK